MAALFCFVISGIFQKLYRMILESGIGIEVIGIVNVFFFDGIRRLVVFSIDKILLKLLIKRQVAFVVVCRFHDIKLGWLIFFVKLWYSAA